MTNKLDHILNKDTNKFLILLLSGDILFVILHCLFTYTGLITDPLLSISLDRGAAEIYQYVKEFWIVMIFFWLAISELDMRYMSWSAFFGYLLVDDSFRLHERLGVVLGNHFAYPDAFGLRSHDFGEITISLIIGSIFICLIGLAYFHSTDQFRKMCRTLLLMVVLLALFGIVVDMIHAFVLLAGHIAWNGILELVEDGGEMVVMSFICWFVFQHHSELANNKKLEKGLFNEKD